MASEPPPLWLDFTDFSTPAPSETWLDDAAVITLLVSLFLLNHVVSIARRKKRERLAEQMAHTLLQAVIDQVAPFGALSGRAIWSAKSGNITFEITFPEGITSVHCQFGVSPISVAQAALGARPDVGDEPRAEAFDEAPSPQPQSTGWWSVLGVGRNADYREVRIAYRKRAMEIHPDRGGRAEDMAAINVAMDEAEAELGKA